MKKQKITIGKLAELGGVSIDTIRYYERFKLVLAASRSESGYRLYDEDSVRRVVFIKCCKALGFTLDEIRKLLTLKSSKDATCAEMLKCTHAKITEAERHVKELTRIKAALATLDDACPGGKRPVSEYPILEHLYPGYINHRNL
jgi:DNA-binding transcriptional MerR regulator